MSLDLSRLIDAEFDLPAVIGMADESKAIRHALLADSEFTAISTRDDANTVGEAARNIRTHIKAVRGMGMELRRPLKAAQDRIKAIEDEYCGPLETRQGQLENLVTSYAKAEALRVQEEERKRQAEVRRIEAERIAAEEKARAEKARIEREAAEAEAKARQQAEGARLKAEAEARAAEEAARNAAKPEGMTARELFQLGKAEDLRRQQAEEARLKAEAEAVEAEAARQQAAREAQVKADAEIEAARAAHLAALSVAVAVPIVEHKVAGAATRQVRKWAVTDEKALLKARPELFKIEIKPSAVNAVCYPNSKEATADNPDVTSVPGLKLWYESETVVRSY